MGKKSILAASIISLVLVIVYEVGSLPMGAKAILLLFLIASWIGVIFVVFMDTKKRNKPTLYAALALALGGLGGLIYYFNIKNESDDNLAGTPSQGISQTSKKNLFIFSVILAVIFGLAFIMTMPFSENSSLNLPLSATMGILFLISISTLIYAKKK